MCTPKHTPLSCAGKHVPPSCARTCVEPDPSLVHGAGGAPRQAQVLFAGSGGRGVKHTAGRQDGPTICPKKYHLGLPWGAAGAMDRNNKNISSVDKP